MYVKGLVFLSRQKEIEAQFGQERWEEFMKTLVSKCPYFDQMIYPLTRIPLDDFITFQNELVGSFFMDDAEWYWRLGKNSSRWDIETGPFKSVMEEKNVTRFLTYGPNGIWGSMYNFANVKSWMSDDGKIHLQINDLPQLPSHIILSAMGFFHGILEFYRNEKLVYLKEKHPSNGLYYVFWSQ